MRIVVTGAHGFIGRNLRLRLAEIGHRDVVAIDVDTPAAEMLAALDDADFVFHLAGVNRPKDVAEFTRGNAELTETVCARLANTGRRVPIVLTSSTQAALDNPYGASKRGAEQAVERYGAECGAPAHVLRLPNVFGKWSRPNYNSAVATFCHNIARGLPITINDPAGALRLLYVDDLVDMLVGLLAPGAATPVVGPVYDTTVGGVADLLCEMAACRTSGVIPAVGTGLTRALYATYVSFLPTEAFAYPLKRNEDPRGVFVEMLKTKDAGQFSFFTARPGITRGGHYHHTKTEKFLVLQGTARFGFRHVVTNETLEVTITGVESQVVETVPGWAHDITNVGADDLVVMLWANEIFDPAHPDTIAAPVLS